MKGTDDSFIELPGKRSAELQKLREKYVTHSIGIVCPAFIESAESSYLIDVDGNSYIDMASGIGVNALGNRPAEIISVLETQLKRYLHLCFGVVYFEEYVRLAERLALLTPGDFEKRSFLNNSGSEAVENSIKVARFFTKRPKMVSFKNAFHGRTMYALALTGKDVPYKKGFEPFPPEVLHAEYPYCYRCPFGLEREDCSFECLEHLRRLLSTEENNESIASLIFEPIQGEGGFVVPPKEYVKELENLCRERSIVFIDDEIQTGCGRTGKMFCIEHFGVVPDILVSGKAIGGGLPLSALTGRAEIMDAPPKAGLGGTFGGNPMSCAAALAMLDLTEKCLHRVPAMHKKLLRGLKELESHHELIGDVRGLGLLMAIELVKDRKTKEPAKAETTDIVSACSRRGMVILSAGFHGNVIRLHPSMLMDNSTLERALAILDEAIEAVSRRR